MDEQSPESAIFRSIAAELRSQGWSVEEVARIGESDYAVDARIWHPDVNDGWPLFLELADYNTDVTESLVKSWEQAQEETGQWILVAVPQEDPSEDPSEDPTDINLHWTLFSPEFSFGFDARPSELADAFERNLHFQVLSDSPEQPGGPRVWFCQYRPGDRVTAWTREAHPGSIIRWKTEQNFLPAEMQQGDPIIYWRTIHPNNKKDRGGLVGTGHVVSTDLEREDERTSRFPTLVQEFFEDEVIPRDEVIEFAGIDRQVWRGAVLDLPLGQALKVDQLLRKKGRLPLFPDAPPGPVPEADEDGQVRVRRDDAEREHDALGRASLAVSLAWTLHEIWCSEQGLAPFAPRAPYEDAAGFVAHIDAPWGGGKTSFANLIARTLNSDLDGKVPEFLKALYPDREDMSGVFVRACHETGKLKSSGSESYLWDSRARRPWIIVPFNAWLNQHVDPPWWSFYQTIRMTCFGAIRRDGVPTVLQDPEGGYFTKKESALNRWNRIRGLWLRELWWRFWTPKVRNAVITLCLVVVVSLVLNQFGLFDLEEAQKRLSDSSAGSLWTLISTVAMVILGGASVVWSLFAALTQSLLPGTPEAAKNYSLGSSDPLVRFRDHFAAMIEQIERPVLVIIDDIDRCEPKFIVEMTRGLQTILKSPRVVYLLLGDRNWIERAFEICHEDMKDINVGPEHTFGRRFVEKAIQLSFVLPAIGEHKEDYVREVLTGRPRPARNSAGASGPAAPSGQDDPPAPAEGPATPAKQTSGPDPDEAADISPQQRRDLRRRISEGGSAQEIDAAGAAAMEGEAGLSAGMSRAYRRAVREEVVLRRAAQREEVEQAIRHRLQPLARFLPENPRHIKRIINAVSLYQDSILLTEANFGEAEFGGERWRQLVIGVVLMVGYPKSWAQLASHPIWADDLIAGREAPSEPSGTNTSDAGIYTGLRSNADFVALLSETELREQNRNVPATTRITTDVVRWLSQVIPISSG